MGLLKNSKLYNFLNERAMNVNQAVIQAKNMLDDPVDGFMSADKAETFLKDKTINKNFKMALTLIDNLAEKMYNKQGEEEFKKHEKQINDIIEYLRFTQKDIYLFNPGPDDSLGKIEQAIIRLAGFVGKSKNDYPHMYNEVHSAANIVAKYKSSLESFSLIQKQSFADLVSGGTAPGTAFQITNRYTGTAIKRSVPTLDNHGKYPGDDSYTYYVQNGQWYAYNITTKKTTNLSEDPKYAKNIDKLNKHFGTDIKAAEELDVPSVSDDTESDPELIKKADIGLKSKIKKAGGGKFTAKQEFKSASQYEDISREIQIFIKGGEGYRSQIYDDDGGAPISSYDQAKGTPTIGIGHAIFSGERSKYKDYLVGGTKKMGKNEALELFRRDVAKHTKLFKSQLKAPITHNMFVALASYCFNTGPGGLNKYKDSKGVSITQLINSKRYNDAARVISLQPRTGKNIGYMAGLEKRRHEESKLFLLGFDASSVPEKNQPTGESLEYVYIADSQGKSGLGKAIIKRMGTATAGKNFFQYNGAKPSKIIEEFGEKIKVAVRNTQNIIFTLGGNGSDRASYLAKDVLENAPESAKITWILAPPAVQPTSSTKYVNTPGKPERQVDKYKATRAKYNKEITNGIKAVEAKLGMRNRINIIDPYPWFEQNVKSSADGVHVDDQPGEKYIATIQSELKSTSQSAVAMKENFVISETNLKRLLSTLLNENIADQFPKNKEEGDKFRNWINDNYSQTEIADLYDDLKDKKLDRSGSHNNEYVKRAWRVFGNEYVESRKLKRMAGKEKARPDRGIPNEFFKFKRGKDTDKSQEIYGLDVAGNIYRLPKKGGKFIKINETKFYLSELKTKILITESDFDLAQEFLLDLKAMGMDRDPQIAKAVVAAESNVQNKILKQKAESGKVYHPLPSPYHTKLSSVAGAKRGTYRHGGRDYGVPEGTAIYSIKDGVVSEISFGGDKFKKYFEFNTNKQAVRDAFPNKKLQEFRRGTFAPIDLTANSLPTKQKNAWKSNDPVKNSTHFFGTGGNWIFIKHEDGIESRYMHLNTIDVKKGEKVKAGQKIGSSGNTGKSTGPHLHFEIRTGEEGSNKNEQKYL